LIRRLSYDDVDTLRRRITALETSLKAAQQAGADAEQAADAERARTCACNQPASGERSPHARNHRSNTATGPVCWILSANARTIRHDPLHSGYSRLTVRIAGAILLVDRSVAFARFATDLVI
jgi:hypothetical protein